MVLRKKLRISNVHFLTFYSTICMISFWILMSNQEHRCKCELESDLLLSGRDIIKFRSLKNLVNLADTKNPSEIGSFKNLSLLNETKMHDNDTWAYDYPRLQESHVINYVKKLNHSKIYHAIHGPGKNKDVVNPHNFKYLLNSPSICKNKNIFAAIYIYTAPSHYKKRMVIRQTWGHVLQYKDVNVRIIFVMGIVWKDKEAQRALEYESGEYNDIVQEDFYDTYENLTYKATSALKWVSTYCKNAKFIIKTDDDIFINMFTLLKFLKSLDKSGDSSKGILVCHVYKGARVFRSGKFLVGKDQFKQDVYPTFCSGSAFIMTSKTATRLHQVSYYVPFFWLEDVYITGFLAQKAGNIAHHQIRSTYILHHGQRIEKFFNGPYWYNYLFCHVHNLNLFQSAWDKLAELNRKQLSAKVQYKLPKYPVVL